MQYRRTEVTQISQTRLYEESPVRSATVDESSGGIVYRVPRAHGKESNTDWPGKPVEASYRRVSRQRLPQIQVPARSNAHAEIAGTQVSGSEHI